MSLLKVNQVTDLAGDTPDGVGRILQVVSVRNVTQTSTASTTFQDTSTTATITPSSTSSKILVIVSASCSAVGGFNEMFLSLFRGTVSGTNITGSLRFFVSLGATGSVGQLVSITHLDSPSTTSPQQYMLGIARQANTTTVIDAEGGRASTITLMEVAG